MARCCKCQCLLLESDHKFNDLSSPPLLSPLQRTPFSTPAASLVKTMTMTVGEFDYNGIFQLQTGGSEEQEMTSGIAFPPASYFLWIIFLVVMPILFTNLLVSLAHVFTRHDI